jgi:hypothetical protein
VGRPWVDGDMARVPLIVKMSPKALPATSLFRDAHWPLLCAAGLVLPCTSYKTTLLADTWHPNTAGYTLMGQAWYNVLSSTLP